MTIIANAGAAKGSAFGALQFAKEGDFARAAEQLRESDAALSQAQESHRQLLQMYAQGEVPHVDVLLSHAQDHFMMSTLAKDLAGELVQVYRQIKQ